MTQNREEAKDVEQTGQVLSFRRRHHLEPSPANSAAVAHPGDETDNGLARYEQDNEGVDYRQRMLMNAIAVVIVAVLIGVGVWIADTIADLEKYQDCVLQGRGNCAPIEAARPHGQ